ncbi:trimeric intracellular cation channel family protein [Crateriforma conspicua]|uniref:Glycine transporter domain-containing protein n=1 Tax=Crateriforma conspicua TaxID=2527996 RepID=A0A5C5Y2A4_9PLAN|nr:trimeric intracellular cation channel family protein [Crateriforma conspicua]QDV63937.1 hypothetical protein Mal65_30840 [Crateriforma conspicua]TWT69300.1 hypothetical protein Pan14r_15850 [Crateriforma conspicua]
MDQIIELLAVIASAIFGVSLARRHNMDFAGVFSMALIVAFGGGSLRDIFLDRHPLFWIEKHHYPVIVFFLSLLTSVVPRFPKSIEKWLIIPDALGLGLFSVAGTDAALESGTSFFVAALMGAITGTFGGVVAEVICNQVPSLFRPAPMYATCAFTGSWFYVLLQQWEPARPVAGPVAIIVIVAFRLMALRFQWILPQMEADE